MTLNQLIKTASKGYPDGLVEKTHAGDDCGDGLASFIALELRETFDDDASNKEQLDTAIDVVSRAVKDMDGVLHSLLLEKFL
jgi:hypothetical protein